MERLRNKKSVADMKEIVPYNFLSKFIPVFNASTMERQKLEELMKSTKTISCDICWLPIQIGMFLHIFLECSDDFMLQNGIMYYFRDNVPDRWTCFRCMILRYFCSSQVQGALVDLQNWVSLYQPGIILDTRRAKGDHKMDYIDLPKKQDLIPEGETCDVRTEIRLYLIYIFIWATTVIHAKEENLEIPPNHVWKRPFVITKILFKKLYSKRKEDGILWSSHPWNFRLRRFLHETCLLSMMEGRNDFQFAKMVMIPGNNFQSYWINDAFFYLVDFDGHVRPYTFFQYEDDDELAPLTEIREKMDLPPEAYLTPQLKYWRAYCYYFDTNNFKSLDDWMIHEKDTEWDVGYEFKKDYAYLVELFRYIQVTENGIHQALYFGGSRYVFKWMTFFTMLTIGESEMIGDIKGQISVNVYPFGRKMLVGRHELVDIIHRDVLKAPYVTCVVCGFRQENIVDWILQWSEVMQENVDPVWFWFKLMEDGLKVKNKDVHGIRTECDGCLSNEIKNEWVQRGNLAECLMLNLTPVLELHGDANLKKIFMEGLAIRQPLFPSKVDIFRRLNECQVNHFPQEKVMVKWVKASMTNRLNMMTNMKHEWDLKEIPIKQWIRVSNNLEKSEVLTDELKKQVFLLKEKVRFWCPRCNQPKLQGLLQIPTSWNTDEMWRDFGGHYVKQFMSKGMLVFLLLCLPPRAKPITGYYEIEFPHATCLNQEDPELGMVSYVHQLWQCTLSLTPFNKVIT